MKAQGVAWILAGSLFMFGCGSDAGGPGSSATSSAEIGACVGEGCPSDCRQVSIKTAFGKSVALCDDTETANDGNGSSSTHEEPRIVGVGVETVPDAGVDNAHVDVGHDAGPAHDAGAGHEADAGGAHDAGAGAGHEADAGAGGEVDAGDAGPGETDGGEDTDAGDAGPGEDAGVADGGCGAP